VTYDYILCENLKIKTVNSGKYLTGCSIKEKLLKETFGKPDTVLIFEQPYHYEWLIYQGNTFQYDLDYDNPIDIKIDCGTLQLEIQDSIKVNIGSTIENILRFFPKSAAYQQDSENGIKDFILYYVYSKEELLDIKSCTSRLIISYIPETKAIYKIHIITFD
jgi:hypothetical protein